MNIFEFWTVLHATHNALTKHFDTALYPILLNTNQYVLLKILDAEPLCISDAAIRLGVDRTTMSRNLKCLYKRGCISQTGKEDGRLRAYELTEGGLMLLNKAHKLWDDAAIDLIEKLDAKGISLEDYWKARELWQLLATLKEKS